MVLNQSENGLDWHNAWETYKIIFAFRVVVNSETCNQARYSIAVFIHPNHNTQIRPFGKLMMHNIQVDEETAEKHINNRFKQTYLN